MDALLHSISYAGTWGQAFLTVEQFIAKAAELGYDGVLLAAARLPARLRPPRTYPPAAAHRKARPSPRGHRRLQQLHR
jgi:sugar phosphate isomerase/epimerase